MAKLCEHPAREGEDCGHQARSDAILMRLRATFGELTSYEGYLYAREEYQPDDGNEV